MKKIIQNILILLLSFFSLFSIGYSATVINSLPYNISVSGDYELGGDLISDMGITILANDVNLDCMGYKINLSSYPYESKFAFNFSANNANITNCDIYAYNVFNFNNSNNSHISNSNFTSNSMNIFKMYNAFNTSYDNLIFFSTVDFEVGNNSNYNLLNSNFKSLFRHEFFYADTSFCLSKYENVTYSDTSNYLMFYNSSVHIDGWTNISSMILCNADNSIVENLNITGEINEYSFPVVEDYLIFLFTDNSDIFNLNISGFGNAISILNSTNNNLLNLNISQNSQGLHLQKSEYNTISNSYFHNNSGYGIFLSYNSDFNLFENLTFLTGSNSAFYCDYSNYNRINNSYFNNNAFGFTLNSCTYNNLTNLIFFNNTRDGLHMIWGTNNLMINLTSYNNLGYYSDGEYYDGKGILILGTGNKIYNSTAYNNLRDLVIDLTFINDCNLIVENVTDEIGLPHLFFNSTVNIDGWNNFSSITLCKAHNSLIKNLNLDGVEDRGTPINLVATNYVNITNLSIKNYYDGIFISLSNSNIISDFSSYDNLGNGFYLEKSDKNIISNFTSYNNLGSGFKLQAINNNNIFSNFEVYNNSLHGVNNYNFNYNNSFSNFSTHDNGLYGLYGWSEIGNSRFYNFSSYNNKYGMYFDDAYNVNNNFTNFNIFNNTYGISLLDNNENFIFSNGSILNSVNEDITISEYTTNNTFFNNYLGSALKMNILSTDVYFNYTNGSGDNIGNYWTDIECIETTLVGTYNVCINPSEYQINPILFDYAPLLTEVKVPYFNHSIQCDFGSGFENCENMIYNLVLEKVRVNCTSLNESAAYPTNASILFKNVQDNKEYFNYTVLSQVGGWFEYDNSDFNLIDSGNFIFETICVDNNSNSQIFKNKTYIPFGVLNVSLISPSSNISVLNNSFFSFISRVECSGGECGSVNFTLDPISGDTSYTISNEGNLYDTYGCTTPATPEDTDEGIYEIVDLGFDFPFFNTVIPSGTSFYVYTNGRLTTNSTYVAYDEINDLNFQSSLTIAPIWYDLYIDSDIYVCANQGISPNKFAVIKFDDSLTRNYNDNSLVGAEIVLFENGDIYYNYGNVENTAGGIFYGLSLGDGNSYTYNVTLDSNAELSYDSIHYSYISNLGYISKNEVVPMNFGSPFYTTTQNPMDFATNSCLANMIDGDFCDISWNVFANATINNTYRFFTYANALNYSSNIVQDNSDFVFIKVNESVFIPVGLIDYISPTPKNNSRYGGENFTIRIDNANQSAYNVTINSEMFIMTDLGGNVFEYTTSFSTITNVTFQVNYIDGSLEERFFTFYPDYSNNLVPAYGFVSFLTSIFIMLFSLFKFENFNQKMNRKNKKGLTVAISAMLLLLVGVSVAVSLSIWYSNFTLSYETKKLNAQVSANSFEIIGIDNISNQNFIYIKSSASGYTIIDKIKVNDQVCELVNSNVLIGLSVNEIQVDCTNIDFNNNLIDVFTKSAIVTKNLPLTNS